MAAAKLLSNDSGDFVWKNLTGFLDPNVPNEQGLDVLMKFFHEVCGGSTELEIFLLHELKKWLLEQFGKELRENIAPKFWSFFKDGVTPDNLISSVENLHQMVGSIFKSSVTNLQQLAGNENIL
ncbi:Hypothetical predicted protein, partial [Paramuricea clavata]